MNTPATTPWYDTPPHADGTSERETLLTSLRHAERDFLVKSQRDGVNNDIVTPVSPSRLNELLALCVAGKPQETGHAELALWIDLFTATLKDAVVFSKAADVSFALDLLLRRRRAGVRARRAQLPDRLANAAAETEIIAQRVHAVEEHLNELRELQAVAVLYAVDSGVPPEDLDFRSAEVQELVDQGRLVDAERRRWLRGQWREWEEWIQDRVRDITVANLPRG